MRLFKILIAVFLVLSLLLCSVSCKNEHGKLIETKTDGDLAFELYGKDGRILMIEVKKDGKEISSLLCDGNNFKTEDLNFDGHKDIMLASSEKGDGYYQCFIYQPNTNTFTQNKNFDKIKYPVLDPENKLITCKVYSHELIDSSPEEAYKDVRGKAVWKWKNGILTQISEEGIEYFSDSKIYCVYTASEIDGELLRNDADDLWFWSYSELTAAGYVWEE